MLIKAILPVALQPCDVLSTVRLNVILELILVVNSELLLVNPEGVEVHVYVNPLSSTKLISQFSKVPTSPPARSETFNPHVPLISFPLKVLKGKSGA